MYICLQIYAPIYAHTQPHSCTHIAHAHTHTHMCSNISAELPTLVNVCTCLTRFIMPYVINDRHT